MGNEYRTYQIWAEGYRATGESGTAQLMGEAQGRSFEEACSVLLQGDEHFDHSRLSHWARRLFDNEDDARRVYG